MVKRLKTLTKALIFVVWIPTQSSSLRKILIFWIRILKKSEGPQPSLRKSGTENEVIWGVPLLMNFSRPSRKRLVPNGRASGDHFQAHKHTITYFVRRILMKHSKKNERCEFHGIGATIMDGHSFTSFSWRNFASVQRLLRRHRQSGVQERIPVVGY